MKTRDAIQYPCKTFYNSWMLKVYLLRYDEKETVDEVLINKILENRLKELETQCISPEFNYYRIGLAFIHFGKRGVEVSIWHIGDWGETIEFFCCTWYCYNRDLDNMELLDSAEPHFSQYEINFLAHDFSILCKFCSTATSEKEFISKFKDFCS